MPDFTDEILSLAQAHHIATPLLGPYDIADDPATVHERWLHDSVRNEFAFSLITDHGEIIGCAYEFLMDECIYLDHLESIAIDDVPVISPDYPLEDLIYRFASMDEEGGGYFSPSFIINDGDHLTATISPRDFYIKSAFTLYLFALLLEIEVNITESLISLSRLGADLQIPELALNEAERQYEVVRSEGRATLSHDPTAFLNFSTKLKCFWRMKRCRDGLESIQPGKTGLYKRDRLLKIRNAVSHHSSGCLIGLLPKEELHEFLFWLLQFRNEVATFRDTLVAEWRTEF